MKKRNKLMIKVATIFAEQSYCKRRKVGAVLAKDNRIMATGYNGTLSGRVNECEDNKDATLKEVLHAEQNVIAFAAKNGISTNGCTLYITTLPCPECAKLIVQSGIKKVVYKETYRDILGIALLESNGVKVKRGGKKDERS